MSRCAIPAASASTGVCVASPASSRRDTTSSWRTLPQSNPRRNDPSVEGARTPPNSSPIPPWRSTSRSSMQSAPASMPATIAGIFRCAFAPTATVILRCSATRPARSQCWARRITGTSPAQDTRFGSSNCAEVSLALCNNRISQMPFGPGAWGLRKTPSSQVRGHLPCPDTINARHSAVDPGSVLDPPIAIVGPACPISWDDEGAVFEPDGKSGRIAFDGPLQLPRSDDLTFCQRPHHHRVFWK